MNFPGLIDLHVHTAPDVRPRKLTDGDLAAAVASVSARGAVLKSHHSQTADRAWLARAQCPGVEIIGSVTLNPAAGGISPAVVEHAIRAGAKIVWLPTLFAENHRRYEGKTGGEPVVRDGKVVPALLNVLGVIAKADIVLATGHISVAESMIVVRAAWAAGVRKVLLTHPEHAVIGMTLEQQRALLAEGPIIFERCFSQPGQNGIYQRNFEANLRAIESLGPACTVLDSDCGQVENPPWTEVWALTYDYYLSHGITSATLREMTCDRPAALMGLPSL